MMTEERDERDPALEAALRSALRRQSAPAGFEARVASRLRRRPAHWRGWAAVAATASVLAATAGTLHWRAAQRTRAETAAGQQLITALRIAGGDYQRIAVQLERVSGGGQ